MRLKDRVYRVKKALERLEAKQPGREFFCDRCSYAGTFEPMMIHLDGHLDGRSNVFEPPVGEKQ